jgi:hypothetical protein
MTLRVAASQAGFCLGEGGGEPLDLLAQVVGSCGGLIVFGLQQPQEFADVHAASSTSSRQVGVGVVRRREHRRPRRPQPPAAPRPPPSVGRVNSDRDEDPFGAGCPFVFSR